MTQLQVGSTEGTCAFMAPREAEWRPLALGQDADDLQKQVVASNKGELKDVLLTSLQMQHLVVLAGSGCSLGARGPSMHDLWNHAVGDDPSPGVIALASRVHHDLEDKNIENFLSKIEAFLQVHDDHDVRSFLNRCKKIILQQCAGFLQPSALNAHEIFLHRLSRRRVRDQRLKVFTTNYDLCFERAAGNLGSVALDGFSFAAPRRYDPRFFSYDIIRRPRDGDESGHYLEGVFLLYKLHGSVNWARSADGVIFEKEEPDPEEACLIYPARGKYQQSFTQPHLESMAQYLTAVREPNTCMIVVGFGFNDDHLSEPILAAARSNPHLRLIIVDPKAVDNTQSSSNYWKQLAHLSSAGEDIWFISAGFAEFAEMIPDLKSLTPAEGLLRAIRNVTREQ